MEGGRLTFEIFSKQFPYEMWTDPLEFLDWFIRKDTYGQMYVKQDDGNFFVCTLTPEVAKRLLEEGKELDNGD